MQEHTSIHTHSHTIIPHNDLSINQERRKALHTLKTLGILCIGSIVSDNILLNNKEMTMYRIDFNHFNNLFNANKENAIRVIKETLRHFINHQVDFNAIGRKGCSIFKEAYAKLWFYLDMGENKQLESYLRNEVQVNPKCYTLDNITSDTYVSTKLKKSKELDNSDTSFIAVEGNAKGNIRFNRDFLIQLKRVAEYNYGVYCEKKEYVISSNDNNKQLFQASKEKVSFEAQLLGNLIYDEEYIPTTIDIKD